MREFHANMLVLYIIAQFALNSNGDFYGRGGNLRLQTGGAAKYNTFYEKKRMKT